MSIKKQRKEFKRLDKAYYEAKADYSEELWLRRGLKKALSKAKLDDDKDRIEELEMHLENSLVYENNAKSDMDAARIAVDEAQHKLNKLKWKELAEDHKKCEPTDEQLAKVKQQRGLK